MQFIKQFGIILAISFLGEVLNILIPLPIPASIYGMVILFACLHFGLLKLSSVKQTADFLIEIMPLMFIPAAVGLMTSWGMLRANLAAYLCITAATTFVVMLVSGWVTQLVLHRKKKGETHGTA